MKKIVIAIPHSHTWLWTQTCISSLVRNTSLVDGFSVKVVVVNNSPWSPAILGVIDTDLSKYVEVIENWKNNKFHATALDHVISAYDFDYMLAMETDVLALCPTWLQWFINQIRPTDYAVGAWHHEKFVNPSCTLYRGSVLREMLAWCRDNKEPDKLRWGDRFNLAEPLDRNYTPDMIEAISNMISWLCGPFADKRGWPAGTSLREQPSGQLKGPGWYEPGQMLHHYAVQAGYTYMVCPSGTFERQPGLPVQTLYGGDAATREIPPEVYFTEDGPNAQAVHLWGGTRALDIIKHAVTDPSIKPLVQTWLAREARFWKAIVPPGIQTQTLELIRKYGWHYKGAGTVEVTDRDRAAVAFVKECYKSGGVTW